MILSCQRSCQSEGVTVRRVEEIALVLTSGMIVRTGLELLGLGRVKKTPSPPNEDGNSYQVLIRDETMVSYINELFYQQS